MEQLSKIGEIHEILLQSKQGDLNAFQQVVERYQQYAYILAYRILFNQEDAEDVVQESFIRVWKHLDSYDIQQKFTTWLYTIVTRLCYDILKRSGHKETDLSPEVLSNHLTNDLDVSIPEEDCVNLSMRIELYHIVSWLPPRQRTIFVLRDLQDLSVKEVSGIMDISEAAVKTNLHYARRTIREKLQTMK